MNRRWRILRALSFCRPAARLPDDEWEYLRYAVLVRDDHRCQFRRLWGWGPICGRTADDVGKPLQIDHIVPKDWGGSDDYTNLRASCQPHNRAKWNRPPLGWAIGRIIRAWGTVGLVIWALLNAPDAALPDAPAPAIAAPEGRWAVVAPGGELVASFATLEDAERAAVGWNAAGGAGRLAVLQK